MNTEFPYEYICIEGNIGSGKTSFCRKLSEDASVELVLEQFSNNPFLPHFYENPARYALPVELFFMTERYQQLIKIAGAGHLFSANILSDYFFDKTLLFARNNLYELEYRLFRQIFESLSAHIRPPDIVLYLHRPIDQLRDHILRRGRPYEQQISTGYSSAIQDMYFDYFRIDREYPVVIVNAENLRFTESQGDYEKLTDLLTKHYKPGVHRVSFVN